MLRVGLTGELGSGKSTVARLLGEHGALLLSSDEMGRAMMEPGNAVYAAIVEQLGPGVVLPDGRLDRRELARLAFDPRNPRVDELNAIVHPAVLAAQEHRLAEMAREQPDAIVVIESALLFTTKYAGGDAPWRQRFDAIVLVTAPEDLKVARFVQRVSGGETLSAGKHAALEVDARARLAAQRIPAELTRNCLQVENNGDLPTLRTKVAHLWQQLTLLS